MAPASTRDIEIVESQHGSSNAKRTVYILDEFHPKAIERARSRFNVVLNTDPKFKNWKQDATAILMRTSWLRADDIAECPRLVAIGKQGVGIDKIDEAACLKRGIKICNTPGANAQAVAEIVLALTMSVARQLTSIAIRQQTEAVRKQSCNGLELYGKTIGIIGMGNIGRKVAKMFYGAFDAPIVANDPFMPSGAWQDIPHKRVETYQELLADSDILTIHVPLTDKTRDMISYAELSQMKRTAIVINAARGGIVNEDDLTRALEEKLIWGAGLDAHEQEPPTVEKYGKLWSFPNVAATPHIGAATEEAQIATAVGAVDNLYAYLQTLDASDSGSS